MSSPGLSRYSHLLVEYEFARAVEYYRAINPDLARKFVEQFEGAVQELLEFPETCPVIHSLGIGRKQIGKFPYFLYILEPDALYIAAVRHHRQDGESWIERLQESGRE